MSHLSLTPSDLNKLSVAVQNWYRHYSVPLDEAVSSHVCALAIQIYQHGISSVDDISRILIARLRQKALRGNCFQAPFTRSRDSKSERRASERSLHVAIQTTQ